jgi:hypothetical protein
VGVRCFSPGGAPADSLFTLLFTRRSPHGTPSYSYAFADQPTSSSYTPNTTFQRGFRASGSGGSSNLPRINVFRASAGSYDVTFPRMPATPDGNEARRWDKSSVKVSAHGTAGEYCSVGYWFGDYWAATVRVNCYNVAGSLADSRFLVSFSSLVTDPEQPFFAAPIPNNASGGVATDGSSTYVTSLPTNILKVGNGGGFPTTIVSNQSAPWAIVANGGSLFWTNLSATGSIVKSNTSGGSIATLASNQPDAWDLAVDSSFVYWVRSQTSGRILRVSRNGGSVTTLASNQATPRHIATDGSFVYWTNYGDGRVMRVSRNGGTSTTLASGQQGPLGIAVNSSSVFWVNQNDGTVKKVPKAGGAVTVLASNQSSPQRVAIDGTHVYWVNNAAQGTVSKVPLNGGRLVPLVFRQYFPYLLALDTGNAYFVSNDGAILKTPKQ